MLHKRNSTMARDSIAQQPADHGFVIPSELPPSFFKTMQIPTPLLKYGKSGSPHFRNFYLSEDKTKFIWYSETKVKKNGASATEGLS